jgi:hypothetical protein
MQTLVAILVPIVTAAPSGAETNNVADIATWSPIQRAAWSNVENR